MIFFVLIGPKGSATVDSAWDASETAEAHDQATRRAAALIRGGTPRVRIVRRAKEGRS